jgi:3-oxoacyl-[acyl-carrier protein] reductase
MPVDDWDRVVNTNLRGTFLCTRVLLGQMLARGDGRIINIASQLGQIGGRSVAKLAELPIGRFGTVDEVTPTAVLLASADGSYYVGQTLGPNGGDVML